MRSILKAKKLLQVGSKFFPFKVDSSEGFLLQESKHITKTRLFKYMENFTSKN